MLSHVLVNLFKATVHESKTFSNAPTGVNIMYCDASPGVIFCSCPLTASMNEEIPVYCWCCISCNPSSRGDWCDSGNLLVDVIGVISERGVPAYKSENMRVDNILHQKC